MEATEVPGIAVVARRLGSWLGPAHSVGQALCYWILTSQAMVIARSTVTVIEDAVVRSDSFKDELIKLPTNWQFFQQPTQYSIMLMMIEKNLLRMS